MAHRRSVALLVLVLSVALTALLIRGRGTQAAAVSIENHLPADPILALTYDLDLVQTMETWLERFADIVGEGGPQIDDYLAQLDERVGMSFRDDVLGAFGPQLGLSLGLAPVGDLMGGSGPDAAAVFEHLLLVARIEDPKRAVRALGAMASLFEAEFVADEDRLTIDVEPGRGRPAIRLHGRLGRDLVVLAGTVERCELALAGFPAGQALRDGADFARVAAQVDGDAETIFYLNLPRLRDWLREGDIPALVEQPRLNAFLEDEWMGVGMIRSSVRVDGGTRTTHFGPEALAGGLPALWTGTFALRAAMVPLAGLISTAGQDAQQPEAQRTLVSLRSLGSMMESYAVDNGRYPVTAGWIEADALRADLLPTYASDLPTRDGWGRPIVVWSDGKQYRLVSKGSDGQLERDWSGTVENGTSADPAADIVFGDGNFIAWPP